jgi:hypothetical protein
VYDVVLYDYMQEVSRLPKALTILPLAPVPTVTVQVTGAFKGLAEGRLKLFKAGDKYMAKGDLVAESLSLGAPRPSSFTLSAGASFIQVPMTGQVDLPAVLKVRCAVVATADGRLKCLAAGPVQQSDVLPGSTLSLAAPEAGRRSRSTRSSLKARRPSDGMVVFHAQRDQRALTARSTPRAADRAVRDRA